MFFDELSLSVLAIIASILILSGFMQQIIRGYKTKRMKDISIFLMVLIAMGAFLWMIYGFEKNDPFIVGINVVAIILNIILLNMKSRYDKKTRITT